MVLLKVILFLLGVAPLLIVPTENNLMIASIYQINERTRKATYKSDIKHLLNGTSSISFSYSGSSQILLGDKNKRTIVGYKYSGKNVLYYNYI